MKQHIPDLCIQTQQQSDSHPHVSPHSGATRIQSTRCMKAFRAFLAKMTIWRLFVVFIKRNFIFK